MSTNSPDSKSFVDHNQSQQRREDYWDHNEDVKVNIRKCARALERGQRKHYHYCAKRLAGTLIPRLLDTKTPEDYDEDLGGHPDWNFDALSSVADSPEAFIATTAPGATNQISGRPKMGHLSRGLDPEDAAARVSIEAAFRSLAAIAEHEELIEDELRSRVEVENFALKVGEHLQSWDMNIGDPVRGVALETEAMKTLFCGGTGDGKSTALETEAEDYYQRNFREGRSYKLIDLVDIDKGENWFYDIPQQQPALRRIREEMDLPADFEAAEDLEQPQVEILLPLTPGLASDRLPYDTDAEAFTGTGFTIPASDLSKRILIPCIMSRLSDDQEQTVRQAYDDVDRRKGDWSLRDLADEIRERDELSPKHKADAVGVLRSLQDLGFIRTRSDDHTLNWRRIFRDTETITLFSQAKFDTELGKYLCIAYLIDKILDLRREMYEMPDAVLLMRELWEVTPQRGRLSPDERAAAVQEAIANRMGKVMRKLRHFDLHLIADTQEPGDLHKQVREMFNRYVVFQSNRDTIDDIFSWTSNDRRKSFWSTLNQKKGQAGIVGKVEPAVQERDIEFISPVAFAPPSHHHYDKDRDTNGWMTRTKYIDAEELARPIDADGADWDDQIPPHLTITTEEEHTGPSVTMRPVAAFADHCLDTVGDGEYVYKNDVREAFNEFLRQNDRDPWDFEKQSQQVTFGDRLQDLFPDDAYDSKERQRNGHKAYAYVGLELTPKGHRYLDDSGE